MKDVRWLGGVAALVLSTYTVCVPARVFTDRTAFLDALPGPAGVLAFDSQSGGTDLSDVTLHVTGGPGTGIRFPGSLIWQSVTNLHLQVVAGNPTSSSPNSLGTDDPGNYHTIIDGTFIDLGLTDQVNAFGLSFITAENLADDDIRLIAGTETASLLVGDGTALGNFGGTTPYYAYFLGIVADSTFNSASIRYGRGAGGAFLFNADDLTLAVASSAAAPVPGTPLLMLSGALAALWRRRAPAAVRWGRRAGAH